MKYMKRGKRREKEKNGNEMIKEEGKGRRFKENKIKEKVKRWEGKIKIKNNDKF